MPRSAAQVNHPRFDAHLLSRASNSGRFNATLILAVASPFLTALALLAIALFALNRRWMGVGLATALVILGVAFQLPLFVGAANGGDTVPLRVMTANLYLGLADAGKLVQSTQAGAGVDVLAVQELTPEEVERLQAAGIDRSLPYRVLEARDEAAGVGICSPFPYCALSAYRRVHAANGERTYTG